MKSYLRLLMLTVVAATNCRFSYAQKSSPTAPGTAVGVIRDSLHNHVLPFATLVVYRLADSSLVSYQLSNNSGEFQFKGLPSETPLRIVATYVGYQSYARKFIIDKKNDWRVDFGSFNLQVVGNELAEVRVTSIAPVRMRGDTLEFNADAFDMGPNAVGEDLLRKLPGLVVWGDGTITVNGRQISSLLVNGKPFFGGDSKVATQNISKDAIGKVQVYRKDVDPANPLDSTMEINLKLKKSSGYSHFGKIGGGYGTAGRFEADADLNFFSRSTQIGVGSAANNTNKVAKDITTLMNNSSYKGVGASIDYQPDLTVQGINRPTVGGLAFQHDFTLEPDKFQTNRITANYFASSVDTAISSNTKTITALDGSNNHLLTSIAAVKASGLSQKASVAYIKHKGGYSYTVSAGLNSDQGTAKSVLKESAELPASGLQSNNTVRRLTKRNGEVLLLAASLSRLKPAGSDDRLPGTWNVTYGAKIGSKRSDTSKAGDFTAFTNPMLSSKYNRAYKNYERTLSQNLDVTLKDFSNLFFDYRGSITVGLENYTGITHKDFQSSVSDSGATTGGYATNQALSVRRNYTVVDDRPAINVSKRFFKRLSSRFQKDAIITFSAQAQIYAQRSLSDHNAQDFARSYRKFIPKASFTYSDAQFGRFSNQWSVSFASSYDFPTIEQLYPIVDPTDGYYIQAGNALLRPSHKEELAMAFQHKGLQPKENLDYSLSAAAGTINDGFAYNINIDSSGRSTYNFVNLNGFRYANLAGSIKKAYKFNGHQVQLQANASINFSRAPGYTEGPSDGSPVFYYSSNFVSGAGLTIYYSYLNVLTINVSEEIDSYSSTKERVATAGFESALRRTGLSAAVNCTHRLTLSSNVTQNDNTSTGSPTLDFTIWNASATYRFLKGNNLELKFSALDLLRENTGVVDYGNSISLRHGTVNVLRQYFIAGLSYFPRKF